MKKKKNFKQKPTVKETVCYALLAIGANMAAEYVADGIVHAVTSTKLWKNKISPRIKKFHRTISDWRDEQIDKLIKKEETTV